MKKFKQNGFTLIEVIISILILSVVSVVLLQLFIKADQLNELAYNKTMASLQAANQIETLVGSQAFTDKTKTTYYTADWQETEQSSWQFAMVVEISASQQYRGLYEVNTAIVDSANRPLLSYQTSLFSDKEVTIDED